MRFLFKKDRTMVEEFADFCIIAVITTSVLTIISDYYIGIALGYLAIIIGLGITLFGYMYSQGLTLKEFLELPNKQQNDEEVVN